ncbi:MAG: PepSY domain-containing protein [Peptococcaceae bacterium]|nr:PepSY domain-containing protein [Peptococcaceae bacterium]
MKKIIGIIVAVAIIAIIGIGAGYYFTNKGSNASAAISETEAQNIALEDAGLTQNDVSFTKTKLDRDDGRSQYDIEFIASDDNTKYDYEIDAESGAILSVDRDTGRNGNTTANNGQQNNTTQQQQNTTTGPQAEGEITADEAKSIALQHAGLAEADVLYVNVEYDRDNIHNEWSVDFATQDTEYDYEINAADGSILKSEKEAHTR